MKIGAGYRPDLPSIVVRTGVPGVSPVIAGGAVAYGRAIHSPP